MPRQIALLAAFSSLAFLTLPSAAYEETPCFMVTPSGRFVDLTREMCVVNEPEATTQDQPLSQQELAEASETSAVVYADAYCEARAQGGTDRQASNAASSAAAGYMVANNVPLGNLDVEWIQYAQSTSQLLCPELQPTGRYD